MTRLAKRTVVLAVFIIYSSYTYGINAFTPNDEAVINITSDPHHASITVNGVDIGRCPISNYKLAPGKYGIKAEYIGYTPADIKIELRATDIKNIEFRLNKGNESRSEWWSPTAFIGTMGATVGVIILFLIVV